MRRRAAHRYIKKTGPAAPVSQPSQQMQDEILKMQQAQHNLEAIAYQKQQLASEQASTERALEELRSGGEGDVYKQAGQILVKSDRKTLQDELEELQALAKTKSTVLEKQEARVKESLAEYEARVRALANK